MIVLGFSRSITLAAQGRALVDMSRAREARAKRWLRFSRSITLAAQGWALVDMSRAREARAKRWLRFGRSITIAAQARALFSWAGEGKQNAPRNQSLQAICPAGLDRFPK